MAVSGVSYVEGLDSGEQNYTHVVATITGTGPTVVYTPVAGKSVQLRWIYAISDPALSTSPLIQVFLGAEEKYRAYALSKRQLVTGPINGPLSISLSVAGSVAVTAILEDV